MHNMNVRQICQFEIAAGANDNVSTIGRRRQGGRQEETRGRDDHHHLLWCQRTGRGATLGRLLGSSACPSGVRTRRASGKRQTQPNSTNIEACPGANTTRLGNTFALPADQQGILMWRPRATTRLRVTQLLDTRWGAMSSGAEVRKFHCGKAGWHPLSRTLPGAKQAGDADAGPRSKPRLANQASLCSAWAPDERDKHATMCEDAAPNVSGKRNDSRQPPHCAQTRRRAIDLRG